MKIRNFTYHRNGVCGIGFFAFIITVEPKDELCQDDSYWAGDYVMTWGGIPHDDDGEPRPNWDHTYTALRVGGMGPEVLHPIRGDSLFCEARDMVFRLNKAWFDKSDSYNAEIADNKIEIRSVA